MATTLYDTTEVTTKTRDPWYTSDPFSKEVMNICPHKALHVSLQTSIVTHSQRSLLQILNPSGSWLWSSYEAEGAAVRTAHPRAQASSFFLQQK